MTAAVMTSANEQEKPVQTVKVGIFENPPLVIKGEGSSYSGFIIDYFAALEPRLGMNIEFVLFPSWHELLTAGVAREIDVIALAQKTESRLNYFDFTKPIITIRNHLITKSENAIGDSMNSLSGVSIAVIQQSANESYLVENYSDRVTAKPVDSIPMALKMINDGQVDAVLTSGIRASYFIQQEQLENLVIAFDTGNNYELAFATRNDLPKLNILLDQAILKLPNSEVEAIKLKWGLVTDEQFDWKFLSYMITAILVLSGLVTVALISNLRLKREIVKRQEFEQQLAALTANMQSQRNIAQKEARTDPLTGINNRRKFDEYLTAEMERFKRNKLPFCLMIIDIDYFKLINDEFGHDVGDKVLVELSQVIQKVIRPYDHFGRVGGEEFAVILPDTKFPEAETIGERILDAALSYKLDSHPELAVTVSIGLAQVKDLNADSLYKQADQALYFSKENGRNRLTCYNLDLAS